MNIKSKPNASNRTISRIKQHGPTFTELGTTQDHKSLECGPAIMVESPDGWVGWLPLSEINIGE